MSAVPPRACSPRAAAMSRSSRVTPPGWRQRRMKCAAMASAPFRSSPTSPTRRRSIRRRRGSKPNSGRSTSGSTTRWRRSSRRFSRSRRRNSQRGTEVTYLGQVHGTMAALARMRPRDRGTIVNVGSALAYRAIPLQSVYCGAKFAVRGFTDALRSELIHDEARSRLVDGASAGGQHAAIRLGAEQDRPAAAAGAADLSAGSRRPARSASRRSIRAARDLGRTVRP